MEKPCCPVLSAFRTFKFDVNIANCPVSWVNHDKLLGKPPIICSNFQKRIDNTISKVQNINTCLDD
jgi:hypothetical protein